MFIEIMMRVIYTNEIRMIIYNRKDWIKPIVKRKVNRSRKEIMAEQTKKEMFLSREGFNYRS